MTEKFTHIHQVLTDCGYPESHDSGWFIRIDECDLPCIHSHFYDCFTEAKAKAAVKSLLTKTDIYAVTVYSPKANPTTYHGSGWSESKERDWDWFIHRINSLPTR